MMIRDAGAEAASDTHSLARPRSARLVVGFATRGSRARLVGCRCSVGTAVACVTRQLTFFEEEARDE